MTGLLLGLDTGAHLGACLLESTPAGLAWVDGQSSREFHLRDGAIWLDDRGPFVHSSALGCIAVEMPLQIQGSGRTHGAGLSIGKALIGAAAQGGRVIGWAMALGVPVVEVTAATWRRALVGKANASDREVATALPEHVRGVPARTNAHCRDAAMVAVWAAREQRKREAA